MLGRKKGILPILMLLVATALPSCSRMPVGAYANRGGPESLMDVSSEQVTLGLDNPSALDELVTWLNEDQPSRMELSCMETDVSCHEAQRIAEQFGVPVSFTAQTDRSVTLVYERIVARDCDSQYIDNPINPYNIHYPSFGCSVAANSLQMISDKQQIVAPSLMDSMDGEKAVQSLKVYTEERPIEQKFTFEDFFDFRQSQ